ncbi:MULTISPECIES: nucleotidyltransferase family protein [Paenibacillus]|uniref:hypothetical protein n=1 Tax=Paenibacillus TaxID=44249 RepID=UPI0021B38A16|nr:hypothetical protein [Paenibacillus sp. IHBB 10380]
MDYQLSSVRGLITDICSVHDSYSRDFLGFSQSDMINLKKKDVNSVFTNESGNGNIHVLQSTFLKLIQEYQDSLGRLIVDLEYDYEYRHFDLRMRIKQKDSIINKLFHYKYDKQEQGGVPINKCLNDLLGFRIMIEDFDHTCEEVLSFHEEINSNTYKMFCYNASKGDYKATHLYFYGENKYFPWELQIWNPLNSEQNELSHKEHKSKRSYINWPHEYNNN